MEVREFVKVLQQSISKEDSLEEVSDRHFRIYLPSFQVRGHFDVRIFERLGQELAEFNCEVTQLPVLHPQIADYVARRAALAPLGTLYVDRMFHDDDGVSIRLSHRILIGSATTTEIDAVLRSMSSYATRGRRRIRHIISEIVDRESELLVREDELQNHDEELPERNIPDQVVDDSLEGVLRKLDSLIGLHPVKQKVNALMQTHRLNAVRQEQGLPQIPLGLHLVFTGNPGTGKTTVARLIADLYKHLGLLSSGHLVETDRTGLVGQFIGQTAPRTLARCKSALGGVLFIDEAYSLFSESQNDYGHEAVATMLPFMESNADNFSVIVAGYPAEMKQFIDSNPGLHSRFSTYVHFPDYSTEELLQIFDGLMVEKLMNVDPDARAKLEMFLDALPRDRGFANARTVRNIVDDIFQRQALRLGVKSSPSVRSLTRISAADIPDPEVAGSPPASGGPGYV